MNLVIDSFWKRKLTTIEGEPKRDTCDINVGKKSDIKN